MMYILMDYHKAYMDVPTNGLNEGNTANIPENHSCCLPKPPSLPERTITNMGIIATTSSL